MRVVVYEGRYGGHVFTYLRYLLPELIELSDEVIVALNAAALETDEFELQLGHLKRRVRWEPAAAATPKSNNLLARVHALRKLIHRLRPEHLYVPTADGLSQMLGATRLFYPRGFPKEMEAEAALHRGGFAYPVNTAGSRLKHAFSLYANQWANWTRLFHVDVLAYDWLMRRGGAFADRVRLLPDPVEQVTPMTQQAGREQLGLPTSGRIIACVGLIDRRKGIDLLLSAFAEAGLADSDRLLLAGRHSADIGDLLHTRYASLLAARRIVSLDRFVSMDELSAAIAAADMVCTPHNRHIGISSIVIRAAAAQRPVLASDFGWSQAVVPKFELGWTCHVQDPHSFAEALSARLEMCPTWSLGSAGHRLLEYHAPENFVAVLTERLRERLGRPAATPIRPWDWSADGQAAAPSV